MPSLTPAIFGMRIFKSQNPPRAWEEGKGQGEVRCTLLIKTLAWGVPEGDSGQSGGRARGPRSVPEAGGTPSWSLSLSRAVPQFPFPYKQLPMTSQGIKTMDSNPSQDPLLGWAGERVESWSQLPSTGHAVGGHPVSHHRPARLGQAGRGSGSGSE